MHDADREDMQRFASSGPAFDALARLGPVDWEAWRTIAARLTHDLAGAADVERRVHHLYLPVLFFCAAAARASSRRPVLIGLQAPQGAGKTTLVRHLLAELPALGLRGEGVSIDDFYLTRADQLALAAAHPGNPYLEHRGYPGTHDIALGEKSLNGLAGLSTEPSRSSHPAPRTAHHAPRTTHDAPASAKGFGGAGLTAVRVPVYDKSAHGGRGDRLPESRWRRVEPPIDVVFVEGWMLGFTPVPESTINDPFLIEPNRRLDDYNRWHRLLDAFVVVRAKDPSSVLRWRVEAEEAMRAQGKPGLDRAAIEDYIRRFLPAYARYGGAPSSIPRDRRLEIWIDDQRRPTHS